MFEAKVIADSISEEGVRLTTLQLKYPRFIHSELLTHRMFSRNSSSSRAIPVWKMLEEVRNNPAMPIHWGLNQPGMQAREEVPEDVREYLAETWELTADLVSNIVEQMSSMGLHKQVANRLIEPFQHMSVVVTATEWDNWFDLRDHEDAQPEIRELARKMKKAMDDSEPEKLGFGNWHLPYITSKDWREFPPDLYEGGDGYSHEEAVEELIKVSVARCARVSYKNHDNSNPNIEKDIALHDMLLKAGHMSPFEHQATPIQGDFDPYHSQWPKGITRWAADDGAWSSNFREWIQYRNLVNA